MRRRTTGADTDTAGADGTTADDEDEDDDESGGEYTMGEIYETWLTADHWSDPEGNRLPIGELNIEEDEVLDPESLTAVKPEEDFEGYTGNDGHDAGPLVSACRDLPLARERGISRSSAIATAAPSCPSWSG